MYLITKSTYIFLAPHMNSLAPSKSEEQVGWALRKFSRVAKVSASRYPKILCLPLGEDHTNEHKFD